MATRSKRRKLKPPTKPRKGTQKQISALRMHTRQPLPVDGLKLRVEQQLSRATPHADQVVAATKHTGDGDRTHMRLRALKTRGKKANSPGYYIVVVFDGARLVSALRGVIPIVLADGSGGARIGKACYRLGTEGDYLFVDISGGTIDKFMVRVAVATEIDNLKVPLLTGTRPSRAELVRIAPDSETAGSLMTIEKRASVPLQGSIHPAASPNPRVSDQQIDAIIRLLPGQTFSSLRQIWLNALRQIKSGPSDPITRLLNQIESEWDRRSEISIETLGGDFFQWPSTDARVAKRRVGEFVSPDFGMLSYLEYHVGRTNGQPTKVRRAILDRVFAGKLPRVFEQSYMLQWGEPATAKRLQKTAESISAFVRNFKRRDDDRLEKAIREWEDDLKYLFDVYYVGKFRFAWPSTKSN